MEEPTPRQMSRRPRRRWGAVVFFALVGVTCFATWRATSLRGLPDIGDPFDVNEFLSVSIPDEENAWTYYRKATELLTKEPVVTTPSTAKPEDDPTILKWLNENQVALKLWLEGSKREKAVYIHPREINFETLLPAAQKLRSIARLGLYEGTSRESKGDLAGAWEIYKAGLRSSRHCGARGTLIERLVGIAIHSIYASRVTSWSLNPKLDAKTLKQALADVEALEKLTPPYSDQLKVEYLTIARALELGPVKLAELTAPSSVPGQTPDNFKAGAIGSLFSVVNFFTREPERSRRVTRLVFANWLSAADLPRSTRAKRSIKTGATDLFLVENPANPALFPLTPEELAPWISSSVFVKLLIPSMTAVDRAITRDESTAAALLVHLAEQAALRETGVFPESPESLVGKYLSAMPVGYVRPIGPPDALAPKPDASKPKP
jgi:hypothetical protein